MFEKLPLRIHFLVKGGILSLRKAYGEWQALCAAVIF
jgi:hypothetical protein